MKRIILSLIVISLTAIAAVGQPAGFLNEPTDARYAGMGGAGYALTSTAFAANYNPAAILLSDSRAGVGGTFNNWQPKMLNSKQYSVGGYYNINRKVGVMASVNYNSHAKINTGSDNFRPVEYTINVGAAYSFYRNLSLGVALKYIGSDMDGPSKGSAFAADIALMYKFRAFNFALGASNLGSKIDYGYNKYSLPARLRAGASYQVSIAQRHNLTGAAELAYQMHSSKHYKGAIGAIGVEYNYNRLFSLRAGYNIGNDKEDKGDNLKPKLGQSYVTVGAGVQYCGVFLDFSCAFGAKAMKNTFLLSLGWRL